MNRDEDGEVSKERYPVVTLILYFGHSQKWDQYRSLKDCFQIPQELA